MSDITELIFKSSIWLSMGLLLYYFLSLAKVFLLVRIQPKLFHTDKPVKLTFNNLWHLYRSSVFKDSMLHHSAINYLMGKGGKKSWKLVGNKKIDFYYNFIDAITSMLKPFIIIAIVWAILKYLILRRIAYNELQIVLGEIQLKIAYIKSLPVINVIDQYKLWLFVGIVLVCGILGMIKKWERNIKSVKTVISTLFVILSIFGGLTFFGADLGSLANNSTKKLRELDLEIKNVHENIYREIAEVIVYEDLTRAISEDVNNNEREKKRLDSLYDSAYVFITRSEIRTELVQKFKEQKDSFIQKISLHVVQKITNGFNPSTDSKEKFVYSDQMNDYFRETIPTTGTSTSNAYWKNQNNWSKGEGVHFQKSVEELKKQARSFSAETNQQVNLIVKNIVDYIGEEMINKGAEVFGIEKLELPKAIVSFLSIEKCKECFVPKIAKVISYLGIGVKDIESVKQLACFRKQGSSKERIAEVKIHHDKDYKRVLEIAKREQLLAIANEKIDQLVREKVTSILNAYSPGNTSGYYDFIQQVTEDYKKEIGINKMSPKEYERVISSISLSRDRLVSVMYGASMQMHPGPQATCPICAFLNSY